MHGVGNDFAHEVRVARIALVPDVFRVKFGVNAKSDSAGGGGGGGCGVLGFGKDVDGAQTRVDVGPGLVREHLHAEGVKGGRGNVLHEHGEVGRRGEDGGVGEVVDAGRVERRDSR